MDAAPSTRGWGWHRLEPAHARQIVAEAGLPPRSLVVDVGAGHGAITGPLLEAGHRVIAVEAHPGRAAVLRARFPAAVVVRADARHLRLPRQGYHVVANPPFGITAELLRLLLQPGSRLRSAHLVVQAQAAQRWAAGRAPGAGRWMAEFELGVGRRVPRSAFVPPPHVPAQLLVVRRRPLGELAGGRHPGPPRRRRGRPPPG